MSFEFKGAFYNCNARNNEEYRKVLEKRKKVVVGIFFMGLLLLVAMVVLTIVKPELMGGFHGGFYTGVGSGLMGGAVVGYLNLREALKAARLQETDEREKEITDKALKASLKAMLGGIYGILVFCAFLSEETILVLAGLTTIFLFSFVVARVVYSKKM